MLVKTRIFGEITIEDNKIICFPDGIIGFPDLKRFALIYDEEKKGESAISWLQSLDEGAFALPVINPTIVQEDYDPVVDDELLKPIGELQPENLCVLVTIKVPEDVTKMTVNLKAPIVINADAMKGTQLIVEDEQPMRMEVYRILKERKGEVQ